jgi:hypothetical protein
MEAKWAKNCSRPERNDKRVRESIRPRAALAAEARMKEIAREIREKGLMDGKDVSPERKKKTKLVPAWDESQVLGSRKKRAFWEFLGDSKVAFVDNTLLFLATVEGRISSRIEILENRQITGMLSKLWESKSLVIGMLLL